MRGLEIRQIKLVKAIADIGNLTRAADSLNISQPALSQQLSELEAYIGRPLFQRTKKRMILTDTGESFLTQGEKVLNEMRHLEMFVDRYSMGETGKLRISLDPTMTLVWLPEVMKNFRDLYPNVELHIQHANDSLAEIRARNIDMAVVVDCNETADLEIVPLYDDELITIMPPNHELYSTKFVTIKDCHGIDLIYHMDLEKSVLYNEWLKPNNVELNSFSHVAQPAAIIDIVAAGFGVGLAQRWTADGAIKEGRIVGRPIGEFGFPMHWKAIFLKKQQRTFFDDFIRFIQEQAKKRRYTSLI